MARVLRSKALLQELMQHLDTSGHKGYKLPLVGTLRNVLRDLWAYEAVVNKWPDYDSVILRPDKENAQKFDFYHKNIFCYGEDPTAFASFIQQPDVIPWHKPLFFHAIPEHLIDIVEKTGLANGGHLENRHGANMVIFSLEVKDMDAANAAVENILPMDKLPAGFTVGRLKPEHKELLLEKWTYAKVYCQDDPKEWQSMLNYLRQCITHNPSGCVYNALGEPISWQIQQMYGSGGIGNTLPEYKNHHLFTYTARHIIKSQIKTGQPYYGYAALNNKGGQRVSTGFGSEIVAIGGHRFYAPKLKSKN